MLKSEQIIKFSKKYLVTTKSPIRYLRNKGDFQESRVSSKVQKIWKFLELPGMLKIAATGGCQFSQPGVQILSNSATHDGADEGSQQ